MEIQLLKTKINELEVKKVEMTNELNQLKSENTDLNVKMTKLYDTFSK
jgi:uncharacterized coiled-coil DUF342 family protein